MSKLALPPCADSVYSLTARIVIITTGEERTIFQVHENLLRSRSQYFDAALSNNWKEAAKRHVNLPHDSTEIVKLYLEQLYDGKVDIKWSTKVEEVLQNNLLPEYFTLANLYVFGEKVRDLAFKNAVVHAMLRRMDMPIGGNRYCRSHEIVTSFIKAPRRAFRCASYSSTSRHRGVMMTGSGGSLRLLMVSFFSIFLWHCCGLGVAPAVRR